MYWEYDADAGRRWNVDPVNKYWESPYLCFNGNPINVIDFDGDDGEDPAKYTVKEGDNLNKIAKKYEKYGVTAKELVTLNKQLKDPNKIYVGDQIALPTRVALEAVRNVEKDLFSGMTRKDVLTLLSANFQVSKDEAIEIHKTIIRTKQEAVYESSPALNRYRKSLEAGGNGPSSSARFVREVSTPLKLRLLQGTAIGYGVVAVVITGGELAPVVTAALSDVSIEVYVVGNMMLNHLRKKAIMGIIELAVMKFGKDALYKRIVESFGGNKKHKGYIVTKEYCMGNPENRPNNAEAIKLDYQAIKHFFEHFETPASSKAKYYHLKSIGNFIRYYPNISRENQPLVLSALGNLADLYRQTNIMDIHESLEIFNYYLKRVGEIYEFELHFTIAIKPYMIILSILLVNLILVVFDARLLPTLGLNGLIAVFITRRAIQMRKGILYGFLW